MRVRRVAWLSLAFMVIALGVSWLLVADRGSPPSTTTTTPPPDLATSSELGPTAPVERAAVAAPQRTPAPPSGFLVHGRVLDERGAAVANAVVVVHLVRLGTAGEASTHDLEGTSDEDGAFEIGSPVAPGTWWLAVRSAGLRLVSPDRVEVDREHGADPLLVRVHRLPQIAGIVVDEHGAPVAGVEIGVDRMHGADYRAARSRADGTFTLFTTDPTPQPVALTVRDPGPCEPSWHDARLWDWGSSDVRIVLHRTLQMQLTVVEAGTDTPVTRYAVTCYSERARSSLQKERRLAGMHPGGRVTVDHVWRGTSFVRVHPLDDGWLPSALLRFEASEAGVPPQRVEVERLVPVTVRVVTDGNAPVTAGSVEVITKGTLPFHPDSPVQDLEGTTGTWGSDPHFVPHERLAQGATDADGRVKLAAPASAKNLVVRVAARDHPVTVVDPAVFVPDRDLVVVLPGNGGIAGRVLLSGFDPDDVRVTIVDPQRPNERRRVVVGPDGGFSVDQMAAGTVRVGLEYCGRYDPGTGSAGRSYLRLPIDPIEVSVQAGGTTEVVLDASSVQPGQLVGRVRLDGGVPEDALVFLVADRARLGAFALGRDGSFQAFDLPPGAYRCGLLVGPERQPILQRQTFDIASGEEIEKTFAFERQRLVLTLQDADGSPLARTHVVVTGDGAAQDAVTDAQGLVVVDPAPTGDIYVVVGGSRQLGPVRVDADEPESRVTLRLARDGND